MYMQCHIKFIFFFFLCRIVSSCMQLLVHDMEMACTAAFNAMVKVGKKKRFMAVLCS